MVFWPSRRTDGRWDDESMDVQTAERAYTTRQSNAPAGTITHNPQSTQGATPPVTANLPSTHHTSHIRSFLKHTPNILGRADGRTGGRGSNEDRTQRGIILIVYIMVLKQIVPIIWTNPQTSSATIYDLVSDYTTKWDSSRPKHSSWYFPPASLL